MNPDIYHDCGHRRRNTDKRRKQLHQASKTELQHTDSMPKNADKSEMTTINDNEIANYKYDRQKNCPHCNAFSLGENCNCCDSRTFECGTDVWENGTCRSADCYEKQIASLTRVVENLQEILKDIRESA